MYDAEEPEALQVVDALREDLRDFLHPLVEQLDAQIDRRLVRTFVRTIDLGLNDVPVGFAESGQRSCTNAQAETKDKFSVGTLARHGRRASYETDFTRSGFVGLLDIQDNVIAYRAVAGSHYDTPGLLHVRPGG